MTKAAAIGRIVALPVGEIEPNPAQPRRRFDQGELRALAESIKENGLLQPITVRAVEPGRYELIAGERRLEASKLAGRAEIAAIVVQADRRRSATLALLENLQRANLTYFEEAAGYAALIREYGYTQEALAKRLGIAQPTVANKLRLLALGEDERRVLEENGLGERHARTLLRLDPSLRMEALRLIVERRCNAEQTEALVGRLIEEKRPRVPVARAKPLRDARLFVNTMDKTVAAIRRMGIRVECTQSRGEGWVEYVLRLPVAEAIKESDPVQA